MSDEPNVPSPYHKVIDILTGGPINYQGMVLVLAKHFPDVFVQVDTMMVKEPYKIIKHAGYEIDTTSNWYKEAYMLATTPCTSSSLTQTGKIPAIRLVREKTGMGLKESKEFVERYLV